MSSYAYLQEEAKSYGIRANQKAKVLRAEIEKRNERLGIPKSFAKDSVLNVHFVDVGYPNAIVISHEGFGYLYNVVLELVRYLM